MPARVFIRYSIPLATKRIIIKKILLTRAALSNFGKAEIDDLKVALKVLSFKNEIFRLQISMTDAHLVAVADSLQDLFENLRCILF